MKTRLSLILAALVAFAPHAKADLAAIAATLAAQRLAQRTNAPQQPVLPGEPASVTLPTNVHTSIAPADLAKVPAVLKADRYAIGLLKWSPAIGTPYDAVVGYEVQRDSNDPVNLVYALPKEVTEFPFNAGMRGMINVVALEFWRVRTVFASGARSEWAISRTFPEKVTSRYVRAD